MENHKKLYEFFLSELFKGDEPELGYIIELMRAAGHINEIQKLLFFVSTPDSPDEDEALEYEVELVSCQACNVARNITYVFHNQSGMIEYEEIYRDTCQR